MNSPKNPELGTFEQGGERHASEAKDYLESYEGGGFDPDADPDKNLND